MTEVYFSLMGKYIDERLQGCHCSFFTQVCSSCHCFTDSGGGLSVRGYSEVVEIPPIHLQ